MFVFWNQILSLITLAFWAGCGASPIPGAPEDQEEGVVESGPPESNVPPSDPEESLPVETVEALEGSEEPRPAGSLKIGDGEETELVLYELIVSVFDPAELENILARWNAEVLDSFEPDEFDDPGSPTDSSIRTSIIRTRKSFAKANGASRTKTRVPTVHPVHGMARKS
jgi:hypothetical protein